MSDVYVIREKKINNSFYRMVSKERRKIELKINNNLKNNVSYTLHDIRKYNEKFRFWNPLVVCAELIKIMEVDYKNVAYIKPRTIMIFHGNYKKQLQKKAYKAEIYLNNKYIKTENLNRKINKIILNQY